MRMGLITINNSEVHVTDSAKETAIRVVNEIIEQYKDLFDGQLGKGDLPYDKVLPVVNPPRRVPIAIRVGRFKQLAGLKPGLTQFSQKWEFSPTRVKLIFRHNAPLIDSRKPTTAN